MIERILSWSALGTAVLFAVLGIAAVAMSNTAALIVALVTLGISILLAISIFVVSALRENRSEP